MARTSTTTLFASLLMVLTQISLYAQSTDSLTAKELQGVTIKARRPVVDRQVDKTVLNIAADATAAGKSIFDVLQQAPGVVIDPNDNISLAGKPGATVFIDGKPTNLSSTDLANLLKSTPSTNVDKVELITNPSARFDAQGLAGIINIRFKRDQSLGWNGSVNAGYSQSRHQRANAGADLNGRSKKLAAFANLAGNDNYQQTQIRINRTIPTTTGIRRFEQRGYDSDGNRGYTFRTGADYYLSGKQTLSVTLQANANRNRFGTYSTTTIGRLVQPIDSSIRNRNDNPSQYTRINPAVSYRYADTLGNELVIDADFARFNNETDNVLRNDFYLNQSSTQPYRQQGTVYEGLTTINITTVKADYSRTIKPLKAKIEAGLKRTNVSTNNDLKVFNGRADLQSLDYQRPDVSRSNAFVYQESVQAGYFTLNKQWKKWTAQAGLRAEYSAIQGTSTDLNQHQLTRPDTSYLNLFPTAFVQYQSGQNSQWQLNAGRRIQRPNYQDMNPFVFPIDPYTSQRGNPYLRPAFTNNLEMSYTYKYAMTVSVNYGRTTQTINDIVRRDGLISYQTVDNIGRADFLTLSVNTPLPITKWWNGYLYASVSRNRYVAQLPDGYLNTTALAFNGYMQHTFTLNDKTNIQLSGWYNAPRRETIYHTRGLGAMNLSFQRKVWQDRGTLRLGVDDLLNTMRWSQSVDFGTNPATSQQFDLYRKWESRRVYVRLTYRFGNQKLKKAQDRAENGALERIKVKGEN